MSRYEPGFRIIHSGSGFQVTLENGYTVSVIFGVGSRSANMSPRYEPTSDLDLQITDAALGEHGSPDAECAVFDRDGNSVAIPGADAPEWKGWQSPDDFARILQWACALKQCEVPA